MDMKLLIRKIQDLSHLGIEDRQITLPKICVVGDQSTGKSSLIEGISEIQVPRADGTCTRCPLEINLSQSDEPWKCVIHLSIRYMYDPPKGSSKVPKKASLGPWIKMADQQDEHFVELADKEMVKEALACAQLAILNPGTNPKEFAPERNPNLSQSVTVKFSPNAVRLDISGPGFPNLSFYDLPGVISQTEQDEESYLVNLVENLVRNYVKQPNSIVLLTLPMTDDATNSSAARIVRNIPGATQRTLGVLTKPDRRPSHESFDQWQEILEGAKFKLGHGYYVIRNNPNPDVSHEQARREEDIFFAQNLWKTTLVAFESRFGVKNLLTALSDLLKRQILRSLPSIVTQIDNKLKAIDEELSTLPNPPTEDVQRILSAKTSDLERKIHEIFDGAPNQGVTSTNKKPLREQWNMIVLDLQRALAKTRPILVVRAPEGRDDVVEDSDLNCDLQIIEVKASPPKKRKVVDMPTESPSTGRSKNQSLYTTKYFAGVEPKRFNLRFLSELKIRSNNVGVPNHLDARAIENLSKKTVEHWDVLLDKFLKATHKLVHGMLFEALEEEFVQYHRTGLYQELDRILRAYLHTVRAAHHEIATDFCKFESEVPFTMSQELHSDLKAKILKELQDRRAISRLSSHFRNLGQDMSDEKIIEKKKKGYMDQLPSDSYCQEIEMMAVSLAKVIS